MKMADRSQGSYITSWQANNEGCPDTRLCFKNKGAVMFTGYYVMGDGQPLACPFTDFPGGEKKIEDLIFLITCGP
jgi:hypothetical protein